MNLKEKLKIIKNHLIKTNNNTNSKEEQTNNKQEEHIKEFDLGVILSFTCGYVVAPGKTNIEKVAEQLTLVWFLEEYLRYDNNTVAPGTKERIINHILKLYPELKNVKYNPELGIPKEEWLLEQKAIFGEKLPICSYNHSLDKEEIKKHK